MGFLGRLFRSKSEMEVATIYVVREAAILSGMGISSREARAQAKAIFAKAKENTRALGRDQWPPTVGDVLLAGQEVAPGLFAFIDKARKEGATDDDIWQWWNMPELERQMVRTRDDINRTGLFAQALQRDMSMEAAAAEVRRVFPMYGDPTNTEHTSGDDRPLPFELKDRVNLWVQRMAERNPARLKVPEGRTFNSVVRAELRAGQV